MLKLCAISTSMVLLLVAAPASAKGILLLSGTKIEGRTMTEEEQVELLNLTLDAPRFLIEREDINHYNYVEKALDECTHALLNPCSCPEPIVHEPSFLEMIGWTGVSIALAASFVAGVVIGVKAGASR